MPSFGISQDNPLVHATGNWNSSIPTQFSSFPANFSFPAFAELQVNTGSNFIPLKFTHVNAIVFDLDTSAQVATGDLYDVTFPAKQFSNLEMPLNFSYVADNRSDITCEPFSPAPFASSSQPPLPRGELVQRLQKFRTIRGWSEAGYALFSFIATNRLIL